MRDDQFISMLRRAIQPLRDRVYMIASRASLKSVDDTKGIQEVQIKGLANEDLGRVRRVQQFGFTSNPPAGTEGVMLSLGGVRGNSVIIATDNKTIRIKNLAPGESAIYTDDGTYLVLKKAGEVEVKAATTLTIDVPDSIFKGNVSIEGTLSVDQATTLNDTLLVKENATFEKDVIGLQNISALTMTVTGVIAAGGFTGPSGGPMTATVDISTTGTVTGSNVIGGGTDLAAVKSTFNTHTHPENGTGGGTTSAPNTTL